MKKLIAMLLTIAMLTALAACGASQPKPTETEAPVVTEAPTEAPTEAETEPAAETQEIQLGTSCITMTVAADYAKGSMTTEDTDENMVAYYCAESSLVDFDVYYWALASDETLEAAAAEEAAEYEAELEQAEVNGITVFCYVAVEEDAGTGYNTVTYLMEDEGYVVELVFWVDGGTAEEEIAAMVATLTQGACPETAEGEIRLGTGSLVLAPEQAFVRGEMKREDTDDCQVGYYCSEDTDVDFDVYYWAKATGETLEEAAAAEAEEYEAEVQEMEINGKKVLCYTAEEESDGETYTTVSYIVEDGDFLAEVVFWLDGEDAAAVAEAIMATLK